MNELEKKDEGSCGDCIYFLDCDKSRVRGIPEDCPFGYNKTEEVNDSKV